MAKTATKDMTVGSPLKLILQFATPLLLGLLFQQVYSLVDTIIVGQFLGVDALAAVGSTGSINFLIIGFCVGICSGFALPVAQRFGAKDYASLRKFVGNASTLSAVISVIMTSLTVILCRNILQWMRTPANILEDAYLYIVVIFAGIPAIILYNLLSGFLRSLGDSVTPLIFLVVSSFMNIGLDLLFILVIPLGVLGAALATVIAQAVSGILCLIVILKKYEILHLKKEDWIPDGPHMLNLVSMGFPMGFQYSITAIGSVILQTAVNGLGSTAVAAMTAAGKISGFMCCPFDALGSTMATYGGQNVGAGKLDRLSPGMWCAGIIGSIYSVIAFGIAYFHGANLTYLFVKADQAGIETVLAQSRQFLMINTAFYIPLVYVNVVRFLIQGMGFSGFAVFAGVFEMIARALVGFFFVPTLGFVAACFASPLAWIFADAFLFPAFYQVLGKLKKWQEAPPLKA